MKIKIALDYTLIARADNKSEKFSKESTLYYHIKLLLKQKGYDVIRTVPSKDGHMTSAPYYIRDRKGKFCWIDNTYAIADLAERFNTKRKIQLAFVNLEKK
jgi:hypothetical protein